MICLLLRTYLALTEDGMRNSIQIKKTVEINENYRIPGFTNPKP